VSLTPSDKLVESLFSVIVSFLTGCVIDTGEKTEVKINTVPVPVGEKSVELENQGFGYKSKPTAHIR
jgi:hypothetical protein